MVGLAVDVLACYFVAHLVADAKVVGCGAFAGKQHAVMGDKAGKIVEALKFRLLDQTIVCLK